MTGTEIAIVGMAGRFPGARDIEEFWRNLRDGIESIRPLTDEELRAAGVPRAMLANPAYVRSAATLDDVDMFDAPFFGFSPREAAIMDPQHRLFLECAWEALEDAGYAPASTPGAVGVFAGCGMQAYFARNLLSNRSLMDSAGLFLVRHTGNDKDFLATRASYCLNLRGPSINVQTACSTSLVALHLACQSLLNGECDMALAGGVTIELPHGHGYLYEEGEILSPDGHCRAFDADSLGTVFGSGAGIVVVKRLADALADGDSVRAVIRGSAVNNDGSGKVGYLAPSVDGQAAAVREAIEIAGVDVESIGYVETHGTGTPVGDPIEIAALTQAFRAGTERTEFCAIGSLKTNIGHLDTAAGVASLIKTVEALRHKQLPASLHFQAPNPAIDFAGSPFYVNAELAAWPARGAPRRAGVSSLGVGGTNAHVVLEEASEPPPSGDSRPWQLLQLSARTRSSLDAATARLATRLRSPDAPPLADVAHTLRVGRQPMRERRIVVCRSTEDAVAALESLDPQRVVTQSADADERAVAFMFAGGGAQYASMGAELHRTEPVYRDAAEECFALLREREGLDLTDVLFPAGGPSEELARMLERPSMALPALFTTQYALAKLWMSWGVRPGAMIGHSMGEYTAAHLAGVFSLEDALALVTLRGRLFERVPEGAMLSVPLSERDLAPMLGAELSIAAVNAPDLCVASGPVRAIASLERRLAAREVESRRVHISVAAHSAMLAPILDEFDGFLRGVAMHPPAVPFVSNLSGTWITADEATDPAYWVRHLRGTVRFADGVRALTSSADRILLEVGPGRTLVTLARQQLGRSAKLAVTSMRHPDDPDSDLAVLLGALGRLWTLGAAVDWTAFRGDERRRRVPLPTYAFERQRCWIDADVAPRTDAMTAPSTAPDDEGALAEPARWFHVPSWKRVPLPSEGDTAAARGPILLFADGAGVGDRLARRLRDDGRDVTVVREGAAFARADGAGFVVRPGSREDHESLVGALSADGRVPGQIVHCWNLADTPGTLETLTDDQRRSFDSLLVLAQALGQEDIATPLDLVVLSAGAQRVGGETALAPVKSLLLGPCRVIPREFPNIRCRSIDLSLPTAAGWRAEMLLAQLAAELASDAPDATIAYRGRDRWVSTLEPVRVGDAAPARIPIRDGGVYLITGGLGGIGLVIAEELARTARARLVLLGRSELPPRERWADLLRTELPDSRACRAVREVMRLESLGAEVSAIAVDVTDERRLAEVVAEVRARFGALHGVVHAAGVLDDGLIQLKSADAAERVLAPKVRGTLALDRALGPEPLDFFVLFSSISALAGIAGQVDYTAANAFLDAFAQARSERDGGFTVAIDWSAWRDVGMLAAKEPATSQAGTASDGGHPLLGRRMLATPEEELFATELGVASHWLLDEHRIRGGNALIPGTGYLEIARAAFASRAEAGQLELRDIAFISPFVVHDDETRELRIHLQRDGGSASFAIAGRLDGDDGRGWEEHVTGSAVRIDAEPPRTVDVRALLARCPSAKSAADALSSANLSFGPRWSALREVRFGRAEAVAVLALPEEFADDLRHLALHPAVMDVATGSAQTLIPGYDGSRDFYVPMSYSRLRGLGPLPATVYSHIRLREGEFDPREIAAFDVTIVDEHGRVLVEVSEFMMRRVADRQLLSEDAAGRARGARRSSMRFDPPAPREQPADAGAPDDAIRPSEGVEAFRRILAARLGPQVVVARRNADALIARLRAPATAPAPQAAGAAPAASAADCDAVAATLATHDAVHEAVVMSRPDRTGEHRLVAYVVFAADGHATVSDLRRFLGGKVPEGLAPSAFVGVDAMPLDAAGAIDRASLPDPFGASDDFAPPESETERMIAQIWQEVLGIDRVSRHDNFFDVGGHSLLAVRVVMRIDKRIGVRLSQAIMVLQTLEQIAAECDKRLRSQAEPPAAGSEPIARKIFNAIRQTVMQP